VTFTGCGHECIPRREEEQLLLDDVRGLADSALEHLDALEQRSRDRVVAVTRGQLRRERLETAERDLIGWEEVARPPWRSICGHRPKSRSAAQVIAG
jgi:hypothetical protein